MVNGAHRAARRRQSRGFTLGELMIAMAIFATISGALFMAFVSLKRNFAASTDFAINHADQMRISDYLAQDFRRALAVVQQSPNETTNYIPAYYGARPSGEQDIAREVREPVLDGHGRIFYGPAPQKTTTGPLPSCVFTDYSLAGKAKLTASLTGTQIPLSINGSGMSVGETVFVKDQTVAAQNGLYVVTEAGGAGTPWVLTAHAVKIRYYLSDAAIYRNQESEADQPVALATDVQDFTFVATDLGKVIKTSITFRPTFRSVIASDQVKDATAFYNTTLLRNNRGVY